MSLYIPVIALILMGIFALFGLNGLGARRVKMMFVYGFILSPGGVLVHFLGLRMKLAGIGIFSTKRIR
jgi:Flp pilus assembly protein protease CpaA